MNDKEMHGKGFCECCEPNEKDKKIADLERQLAELRRAYAFEHDLNNENRERIAKLKEAAEKQQPTTISQCSKNPDLTISQDSKQPCQSEEFLKQIETWEIYNHRPSIQELRIAYDETHQPRPADGKKE